MTMTEPIISVSGLRGVVGESLTPAIAAAYVAALATELDAGPLVVTRDSRPSGRFLADIIRSTLAVLGRDVIDGGIAATPTTGTMIRRYDAAGGVQISASHNPSEYNGIKLFGAEGRVLSAERGERILNWYRAHQSGKAQPAWAAHHQLGTVREDADPHRDHLQRVLATIDADAIRQERFRILLDSNHGAGSTLGLRLLESLGCDVVSVGEQPDGLFAHPPEPTSENLAEISDRTAKEQCAVGFCQDPDADRLALIDEQGRYVGEEFTLALCCEQVLSHRKGPVVTNCSSSRMTEDLARRHDVPFFRSKVGEANVADMMIAKQAVFGGEGNGGPIDPEVGYVRDSFVGMARVLSLMSERGQSLSSLVNELPQYAIYKTKTALEPAALPTVLQRLKTTFADAEPSELDGLRLDWPGKWLLVRASNTEPIVRLIAEAATQDEARALCERAAQAVAVG